MPLYVPGGGGASALDDLTDVDTSTTAPVNGDRLYWNGTLWVPASLDLNLPLGGGATTLTNVGAAYDTTAAAQTLGFAKVDLTTYTHVEFYVTVNKIGTGTQSWQLWNDTFGQEIAVINDSGGTGIKTLSVLNVAIPALSKNFILVRVRAKSTTATDDPVFFSAFCRFQRHP